MGHGYGNLRRKKTKVSGAGAWGDVSSGSVVELLCRGRFKSFMDMDRMGPWTLKA